MNWELRKIGNAKGSLEVNGEPVLPASGGRKACALQGPFTPETALLFRSERGKLADSEDSFLFFCTPVSPDTENFVLSGTFTVTDAGRCPGWLSGFGLFVADTLASGGDGCRFRNLLSVGRHRALVYDEYACGLRVVSGHTDPLAEECGGRRLDASRTFRGPAFGKGLRTGETFRFALRKTGRGFTAGVRTEDGRTGRLSFPGCGFLTVQDPGHLYVGFGVAGSLSVEVRDLQFETLPGKCSATPGSALRNRLPPYPFSPEELPACHPPLLRRRRSGAIWVSSEGGPWGNGTPQSPLDLQTALFLADRNSEIVLRPGTYSPAAPYLVPLWRETPTFANIRLRPERPSTVILDGSRLKKRLPVMILRGRGWRLEDLIFQRGPSVGLLVCGGGNVVERCAARENGDTGILLCAFPGAPREDWPADNLVSCCDSYGNRDPAGCNADGFGAKLSVGEGNRFVSCIAHHNVDDGFDLFAKRVIGPIGAVTLEDCVAYENGRREPVPASGSGFKLGGEGVPVCHTVRDCVAYGNASAGFHANNNPVLRLQRLVSWANGENRWRDNYALKSLTADGSLLEDLLPSPDAGEDATLDPAEVSSLFVSCDVTLVPTRRADGSIDRRGLFQRKPEP